MNVSEAGGALCSIEAERVTGFGSQTAEEMLDVEEPLEIQLCYGAAQSRAVKSISVTMRTPRNDFELAAGFLMTEGVVRDVNRCRHRRRTQSGNRRRFDA
jgi:FdhD protein